MRSWLLHPLSLFAAMLASGLLTRGTMGQAHEPDPQAAKVFEEMVQSYRDRPGLIVRTTVTVELLQGDLEASSNEVKAEFVFGRDRSAVVKLRGFTVYLRDGRFTAIHEGTETSYFSATDEGSPYYALLTAFMDIPFPHLAIFLGEDEMENLWMQFHPRAPWLRPTGVQTKTQDEKDVIELRLSSDFETLEIEIDPETRLMNRAELRITAGQLVQKDTTLIYDYEFEYDVLDDPLDEATFTLDPGDRLRVDQLGALLPRRLMVLRDDDGDRQGVAGGGIVGSPAPPFELDLADGERVSLEGLVGQVVVLDFWATWCRPCLRGLPILHQLDQWSRENGLPVRVLTINSWEITDPDRNTPDHRLKQAREFWEKHGFHLPIAMDFDDRVAAAYGVRGIPTTVILRADGVVHMLRIGVEEDFLEQLKKDVGDAIKALEL